MSYLPQKENEKRIEQQPLNFTQMITLLPWTRAAHEAVLHLKRGHRDGRPTASEHTVEAFGAALAAWSSVAHSTNI